MAKAAAAKKDEGKKSTPKTAPPKAAEKETVTVITSREALAVVATIAGWPKDDPDISAMSDSTCDDELGENIGILTAEDMPAILAMDNGQAIWDFLCSKREDLAAEKIAEQTKEEPPKGKGKGKGKAEKPPKEKKPPTPPKEPAAPKYTRSEAFADTLKKAPKTVSALIKDSDSLYAKNGGKSNEKESKWMAGYAFKLLIAMKLVVVEGDNIKSIADCIIKA